MNPAEESRKRRKYDAFQSSKDRSISPPPKRHAATVSVRSRSEEIGDSRGDSTTTAASITTPADNSHNASTSTKERTNPQSSTLVPSPIQLNFVEQLPASSNVDCVSLGSILGDPMIKECWLFNYLFDLNFVM